MAPLTCELPEAQLREFVVLALLQGGPPVQVHDVQLVATLPAGCPQLRVHVAVEGALLHTAVCKQRPPPRSGRSRTTHGIDCMARRGTHLLRQPRTRRWRSCWSSLPACWRWPPPCPAAGGPGRRAACPGAAAARAVRPGPRSRPPILFSKQQARVRLASQSLTPRCRRTPWRVAIATALPEVPDVTMPRSGSLGLVGVGAAGLAAGWVPP